jgi:ubiquinone biosynthesis accessory factor UbiJ
LFERIRLNPIVSTAVAAVNHLLKQHDDWAPQSLQGFAGAVLQVNVLLGATPATANVKITEAGYFERAVSNQTADPSDPVEPRAKITVALTPDHIGTFARDGMAGIMRQVQIQGDAEFAAAIGRLAKDLHWDAEEDLSRVVGDIAAHRIATTSKEFAREAKNFADQTRSFVVQKAVQDDGPLISVQEFTALKTQLRNIRDGLDRLEQRVKLL